VAISLAAQRPDLIGHLVVLIWDNLDGFVAALTESDNTQSGR
jgi:hypothetical protein